MLTTAILTPYHSPPTLLLAYRGYTYYRLPTTHSRCAWWSLAYRDYTYYLPHPTDRWPFQVVLKELCVHDRETTQFNFFCKIIITEFAAMRTKTAEDMDLMRKCVLSSSSSVGSTQVVRVAP